MKLILISPYAMSEGRGELLKKIYAWGKENVISSKLYLVSSGLARKHFDFLQENEREKVVHEWSGATIEVILVKNVPEDEMASLEPIAYVSPSAERSERDARLWFPENYL